LQHGGRVDLHREGTIRPDSGGAIHQVLALPPSADRDAVIPRPKCALIAVDVAGDHHVVSDLQHTALARLQRDLGGLAGIAFRDPDGEIPRHRLDPTRDGDLLPPVQDLPRDQQGHRIGVGGAHEDNT
jgi:hypothetical protein